MPPQVNATLTAVTGATAATGGRDAYDDPAGPEAADAGAGKFAGTISAYYSEQTTRDPAPAGGIDVNVRRRLIIDTADFHAAGIDTDDVLTIAAPAGTITARAQAIAVAELSGIPGSLQTTRIDLELA